MKNDFRFMKEVGKETIQNPQKKYQNLTDGSKLIDDNIIYQITKTPIEV